MLYYLSVLSFTSCKSDDDSLSEGESIANAQNATEDTSIPVTSLETGISIESASKVSGTAPTPNNQVDFNLNSTITEAFQETGLKIQFSSDDSVTGAYIQFKDADGNATDTYFDVPAYAFNTVYNKSVKSSSKKQWLHSFNQSETTAKSSKIVENFTDEIQIDFNAAIPAGEFCYDICLYDSNNNISQIQTVCVTVEAWGGNASFVGKWTIDRREPETSNNSTTFQCDNGNEITTEYYKEIKDELLFELNEDGSYYILTNLETKSLDESTTKDNCVTVYENEILHVNLKSSGNWAYNQNNQTLTLVNFKYEDFIEPENNKDYTKGLIDGVNVEIISNQLVLTLPEGPFLNGAKIYFNKN